MIERIVQDAQSGPPAPASTGPASTGSADTGLSSEVKSTAEGRLELGGGISLSDPVFLLLLPVAVIAALLGRARRRHVPGRTPRLPANLPRSFVQRLSWVPGFCRVLALVLGIVAVARPLRGNVELSSTSEGVDIALLVDRSSSMEERASRGAPTRFSIVKDVVADFAVRRMTDREGAADSVALITFALYPELLCPFTLDADALSGVFAETETEKRRELDATGIGVALAKAVAVLRSSESQSRIIVLLTDGLENVHVIEPLEAARLAAEEGIKIYTVFAGPRYRVQLDLFGRRSRIPIETDELAEVAKMTGAEFYHAEEREDLEQCYQRIEELERTEREQKSYAEHFDLYPRVLLAAFVFYVLSWFSAATWARRLP